jgi:hypothetical protein
LPAARAGRHPGSSRSGVSGERAGIVRVANAGGFWGDDPFALRRQLLGPTRLDYISIDFLAELSMSILQKQRARDPSAGWARDFLLQIEPLLGELRRRGTRVVTNAGGVHPRGCAEALLAAARARGLALRVAVVLGDDILPRIGELRAAGVELRNMETGEAFDPIAERLVAANAYFGALPVREALRFEPDVVVCGRVTDTGITLGALMAAFDWSGTDFDRLAAGIVAGHLIECGAQATGGNFSDWPKVRSFDEMGFPILECSADGSFVLTRQPRSGGLVSCATVREQLVYEMGDPRAYLTPDCVADFTSIALAADGPDRVRVSGVRGAAPTPFLKVSAAYSDGYKVSGSLIVSGPDARRKAARLAQIFWSRLAVELERAGLGRFEAVQTELVGDDSCHGRLTPAHEPSEILLRLSARDAVRAPLELFRKVLPSLILSGPPGVAVTGGAPPISEVVSYWPCLVPRYAVLPQIEVWEQAVGAAEPTRVASRGPLAWLDVCAAQPAAAPAPAPPPARPWSGQTQRVPLLALAHARSGDKGDTANIGLIGRSPECYAWLARHVTAARVRSWFRDRALGPVRRHLVPNLWALNFLLEGALGGGGTRSLRLDPQGKTLAQALLRCEVTVPRRLLGSIRRQDRPARGELSPARRPGGPARSGRRRRLPSPRGQE